MKVNRWFWKCSDCLTPVAVDVDVTVRANVWSNEKAAYDGGVSLICGACGGAMWLMGRVQGGFCVHDGKACACDARCTGAAGPNCDCSCGGENHGTGATVDVTYTTGPIPVARVVCTAKAKQQGEEYRAACERVAAELDTFPGGYLPEERYRRKRALLHALNHSRTLSSHAGRMKCLEAVSPRPTPKPVEVPPDFTLSRPAPSVPAPLRFSNNVMADGSKRAQKVLFTGLDCLPGQGDLFG